MIWQSVIGQERVKAQLLVLLKTGRLAHAYLFQGDDGVGKDAMAIQLAAAIHCRKGDFDPCGKCPSCLKLAGLQHPDVHLVFSLPVGKDEGKGDHPLEKLSGPEVDAIREQIRLKGVNPYHRISVPRATVIKVNSIRDIRRESVMSTMGSNRRVVIISRADEMNEQSSNALLKTLEEPATETLFILTSMFPERLLPTIRSRCHSVQFDPLGPAEIAGRLVSDGLANETDARLVAHLAMGSFRRASELLGEDMAEERQQALEFVRLMMGNSFSPLMKRIDELSAQKDRELVVRFLNLIALWFRDTLVHSKGGEILNVDQSESIKRFVDRFPAVNYPDILGRLDGAVSLVRRNGYIPLVLVRLSIELKRSILLTTA
ncbi:MAG: DNA polymerase III subunit delta' [Ignavibacteria bacterium]|nr:DNA polymerase III subunit delta' [Ignavibacteria bacterium]